jgi:hypothetical protein
VSESNNIHWAENEDLLEQFVLGRLESAEVAKLEKHLQECGQCQKAVANERELVAGIRLVGRESMKRKLAQRLEQRKAHSASWYRVAGVAAGIVLLVTVGIYNRWFTGAETQIEKQDRADKIGKRLEPAPPASPQGQLSNAEKPLADAEGRARDAEGKKAPNLGAGAPNASAAESGKIAEAEVDKLKDLKASEIGLEDAGRRKMDRISSNTVPTMIASNWVEGIVISHRDQNAPAAMEMAANAKDERAVLRKEKEENLRAGKAAREQTSEHAIQNFVVTQKLLSELPPVQRAQQQNTSSIQALLQKNTRGTLITVFLDSLLTKKELEQAHVQAIREDSIILNLGNRLVGYKLPPEWSGQGLQQLKKEK